MGGVVILLFAIILIVGIFLPIYCFLYGKKVLLNEKRKLLFTLYNSAIITLCYLFPLYMEDETYIYSLILFGWCELWTAMPLIKSKKQNKNINTAEWNSLRCYSFRYAMYRPQKSFELCQCYYLLFKGIYTARDLLFGKNTI